MAPGSTSGGPRDTPEPIIAYFGYGSLVNRATLRTDYLRAAPARLVGWRRSWRPRPDMPGFPAALLTVRPQEGCGCDGLLVFDRASNLAAVDAREARYRRIRLCAQDIRCSEPLPAGCALFVYVADETTPRHREPPRILQSIWTP